jgi:hypothetical protein
MIDLDQLLRLRLIVARFGELDLARWWNSKGQLGRLGAATLRRGFPRTHYFAQARSVFAIAAHRCSEVFDPPNSVTLWRLPDAIEEEFEARWEVWLDNANEWSEFFESVAATQNSELVSILRAMNLVTESDVDAYSRLRRSPEARSVELPGTFGATDSEVALLALGFAKGEPGALTVPYALRAGK